MRVSLWFIRAIQAAALLSFCGALNPLYAQFGGEGGSSGRKKSNEIRTRAHKAPRIRRFPINPPPRNTDENRTSEPVVSPAVESRNQGLSSLTSGDYEKAVEFFNLAVKQNPGDAYSYYYLGAAYSALKKYDEVVAAYEKAIRLNPQAADADTYYNLGGAYFELKNYPEAAKALTKAIAREERNNDAYIDLGDAYSKMYNWPEAIKAYNKALEIKPDIDDPDIYYNLGVAYDAQNQSEKAIEFYKKAIEHNVTDAAVAYYKIGFAYYNLNKQPEAVEAFKKELEIKSDDLNAANAYYYLGEYYTDQRKYAEAIEAYKGTIRINPQDALAHYNLAVAYFNSKPPQKKEAISTLLEAIKGGVDKEGNPSSFYLFLGKIYLADSQNSEAIEPLEKAVNIASKDGDAHYQLGLTYKRLNRLPEAVEQFKQAISLGNGERFVLGAHYNLGEAYLLMNNTTGAQEECALLKPLDPNMANRLCLQIK
ncbi:MAG: tetratricopeptide repeat protein [Pyrinomonadaceae bacterium]